MFKWSIEIPTGLELEINQKTLVRSVATKVATKVRQRLRKGQGARGALPMPDVPGEDQKGPLRRTGTLLKSIKGTVSGSKKSAKGVVRADGYGERGRPLPLVMNAQLAHRSDLAQADPMGMTSELDQVAAQACDDNLSKQRIRITAKGKKTKRSRKR